MMTEYDIISNGLMDSVKRQLNITWDDEDTNAKILDIMQDAESSMNYRIGQDVDYSIPGMERRLYLNYVMYLWNDCVEEFDKAYRNDIYLVRRKYEVEGAKKDDSEKEEIQDIQ